MTVNWHIVVCLLMLLHGYLLLLPPHFLMLNYAKKQIGMDRGINLARESLSILIADGQSREKKCGSQNVFIHILLLATLGAVIGTYERYIYHHFVY